MAGESALIPIPSEVVMPFAGALAGLHKFSLIEVILAGTLGNLVGSYIAWIIGRTGGRAVVLHMGRYLRIKEEDLHRSERWFDKRGDFAVFIGRLLPVVRTFISLPAGVAEMNPIRFGIFTFAGSLLWSSLLAILGYEVGSNWNEVATYVKDAGYFVALVILIILTRFFFQRYSGARTAKS